MAKSTATSAAAPSLKNLMHELESLGSEQTRKTWARHGITGECFGVKYADLYKLQKQIGVNHALAMELWRTGNHDARILATLIADAEQMSAGQLDEWAKSARSAVALDAVANLASKTPYALKSFQKWIKSREEWTSAAGWHLLAYGLSSRTCGPAGKASASICDQPDSFLASQIGHIEEHIHTSPNRTRYAMNSALIAIGGRGGDLQQRALEAAKRIGEVDVDHGDTACKTPDAETYILKMAARKGTSAAGAKRSTTKPPAKKSTSTTKMSAARKATTATSGGPKKTTPKPTART